ncbi:MAG: NAD(P)H-dependent oxidoreductase, partial [Clostridiales bacterium]|nr:NAD(P)H-dependent oxidoreductase [Clostridiales bacterium]
MKKVLIVNASKRRNGNSYALAKRFAELLEGKAEVTTFNIGEKDVHVCLACDSCKRQHTPNCVQKDDFTALIPAID